MTISVRPLKQADRAAWLPLWLGYNAFYNRPTVAEALTDTTWGRLMAADWPMHALGCFEGETLLGITHYLFHDSTTMIEKTCYLQDLFTVPEARGKGVERALIEAVYAAAKQAGSPRMYWHTHETNATAQALYDKVAEKPGFIMYRKAV